MTDDPWDIVNKLRRLVDEQCGYRNLQWHCLQAADEIERLRAALGDPTGFTVKEAQLVVQVEAAATELRAEKYRNLQTSDEIERLRGLFMDFGRHLDECEANYSGEYCDCGWDKAVASLPDDKAGDT